MNIRVIIITLLAAALGTGVAYQLLRPAPPTQIAGEESEPHARAAVPGLPAGENEPNKKQEPLPPPPPRSARKGDIIPGDAMLEAAAKQTDRTSPKQTDPAQYWDRQAKRFNGLLEQLAREQDPSRRKALIQTLARYVRIDTLGALDWAMSLQDPSEQRMALDAINKASLSGIGARIEADASGFPKIRETTVLSAIAATGQVEPGDYITGMIGPDGQPISFKNLSLQEVVKYLRGQPGSEVQLLMERWPIDGKGEAQAFDVSIQRSLLVVQPPY